MITGELRVIATALARITDLGRRGHTHRGISPNGAVDAFAARTANALVGNHAQNPLIEATGQFRFVTTTWSLIAITGASVVALGDAQTPQDLSAQPFVVAPGVSITVEPKATNLWSYIAVSGQFAAERVLGSAAVDPLLRIGRSLMSGDAVSYATGFDAFDHPYTRIPLFRIGPVEPALWSDPGTIPVMAGPDSEAFVDVAAHLRCGAFTVTPDSDAVGVRLTGVPLNPLPGTNLQIRSKPVPAGAVEATPDGQLIVLLRGRPTNAGYPIVAVTSESGVDGLGQARPGQQIKFRWTTVPAAVEHTRRRREHLELLTHRARTAFSAADCTL